MHILIVLMAIFVISCASSAQEAPRSFEERIEYNLSNAEADLEDLSESLIEFIVERYDIEGQWESTYWHDRIQLIIKRRTDGKYAVIYNVEGDLSGWTLIRIASFENGILTFEKAVNEYPPVQPFTNFYLIKTKYGTMFVSQWLCRYILAEKDQRNWNLLKSHGLQKDDRTCKCSGPKGRAAD